MYLHIPCNYLSWNTWMQANTAWGFARQGIGACSFSFPEKWWKLDQLGSANGFLWGKWWIKSLQVSLGEVFDRLNVRYDPLLAAFATTSAAGPFFSIALGVLIVDNPLTASVGLARASPQAWLPGNGICQSSQLCFKILYKLLAFDCADWTLSGHFKYSLVFCQTRLRRQAWEMVGYGRIMSIMWKTDTNMYP